MGALTEMATMQITTWTRATGSTYGSLSRDLEASVLGEQAEEFDIEAIERDWREAIDEALPEGIFLAGGGPGSGPGIELCLLGFR